MILTAKSTNRSRPTLTWYSPVTSGRLVSIVIENIACDLELSEFIAVAAVAPTKLNTKLVVPY